VKVALESAASAEDRPPEIVSKPIMKHVFLIWVWLGHENKRQGTEKKIAGRREKYEGECMFTAGFVSTRIVSCVLL